MTTIYVDKISYAVAGSNTYIGVGAVANGNLLRYWDSPGPLEIIGPPNIYTGFGTVKNGWGGTDQYQNIPVIEGSKYNDTIYFYNLNDLGVTVDLMAGDDYINGENSQDTCVSYWWSPSGVHVDLQAQYALDGWGGRDTLINVHHIESASAFNDTLLGDGGDDFFLGCQGNDIIDGRGGFNFALYFTTNSKLGNATKGVEIDLILGIANDEYGDTDTLKNIDGVVGSRMGDRILGNNNNNYFDPISGDDYIDGREGKDGVGFRNGGFLADPRPIYVNTAGHGYDGAGGYDTYVSIEEFNINSIHQTKTGRVDVMIGDGRDTYFQTGGTDALITTGAGNDVVVKGDIGNYTVIYEGARSEYFISKNGDAVSVTKPSGSDYLVKAAFLQFKDGLYNIATSAMSSVIDRTKGSIGDDSLIGTVARDRFDAIGGNDLIYGGAGIDTAKITAAKANATAKIQSNGMVSISGSSFDLITDSVERFEFTDGTLAFDDGAAQAYRIYQAAFARIPDKAGLSYWVKQMDDGMTLRDVAYGFIASAEFKTAYGSNPTNIAMVEKLYLNVLGRPAEKAGVDYWVGLLNGGTNLIDVVAGISESQENRTKLAPIIGKGVELDTSVVG